MSQLECNYTSVQKQCIIDPDTGMEDREIRDDIISHDQMIFILRVLLFGVIPAVSVLGIVGNIFSSIIILFKHGLHKCSNILLTSLAVTDLTFLVAFNSVPKILYDVVGIENGYGYSRQVSWALFILFNVFNVLDYTASTISLTMPMLITFERVVAVYYPFKFNVIITPRRTWCTVAVVSIFWLTVYVYMSFWFSFVYTYDMSYNITVGRMERSSLYYNSQSAVEAFEGTIDYMILKIPPAVTLIGCIFISVKVKMASMKRMKMTQTTSKEKFSNRTTKMLLAVCVVYMLACVILSMPSYIPQYVQYSITGDTPNNLGPIMYQVINIAICFNSSANFIVYVAMNKNFRDTYKSLFTNCRRRRG